MAFIITFQQCLRKRPRAATLSWKPYFFISSLRFCLTFCYLLTQLVFCLLFPCFTNYTPDDKLSLSLTSSCEEIWALVKNLTKREKNWDIQLLRLFSDAFSALTIHLLTTGLVPNPLKTEISSLTFSTLTNPYNYTIIVQKFAAEVCSRGLLSRVRACFNK